MNHTRQEHLNQVRALMADAGIDAVIINKTDPHQSEYIGRHWAFLRRVSGFTGSAATMVVTRDRALLWTDSRYFIQANDQLQGSGIELMKDGLPDTPSIQQWLTANLTPGQKAGIDGMLFSATMARQLADTLAIHDIGLITDFDPIGDTWPDRSPLPADRVFIHEQQYAGQSASDKIASVLDKTYQSGADAIFLSSLDEIAWTLNIRAHDIHYTTVATSFLYLSPVEKVLFVDPVKIDNAVSDHLSEAGVHTLPYSDVLNYLTSLPDNIKVLIEPSNNSIALVNTLGNRALEAESPIALMKSVKNDIQVAGIRAAMERDGVAMIKSLMEIERHINNDLTLTELDIKHIFRQQRSSCDLFYDESFGLISGFGPHGAIVHYEANETTNATIKRGGLLLIDSGGQYLDGTTDITRTIAIGGTPTPQQRHDFTLVMKGHIALSDAVFPRGTTGHQLDVLARQYLWHDGLNYLHGTGHGVGHFLNVHEGPQSIRLNHNPVALAPGMVTSNEPGLYREGQHGIRCENLLLTVPAMTTEFGQFLKFETLTLCPFDLTLFDTSMMTDDEIKWLNNYHRTVRDRLSPLLNSAERTWLEIHTQPLTK